MQLREKDIAIGLMAALPILHLLDRIESALIWGSLIIATSITTALFFRIFENCFPKRLFGISWLLGITTLVQIGFYLRTLSPYWGLSLAVLFSRQFINNQAYIPNQTNQTEKGQFGIVSVQLLIFGILVLLVGASREAGMKLEFGFLNQPVSCFFICALIAICMKSFSTDKA